MGDVPDWYGTLVASKYLGVAPWELIERPSFWTHVALAAAGAEARASKQRNR